MQRLDDILVHESDDSSVVDLRWDPTSAVPSQHHSGVHPEKLGELSSSEQFHGT
jgi:hypothetical protein